MSTPVVVQGTAVETPSFGASPEPMSTQAAEDNEAAKTGCKDPIFAILFYANITAIVAVAVVYGPGAFEDTNTTSYEGYIIAVLVTGVLSLIASGLGLLVMMKIPETLIKVSLIFVVVMSLVYLIISIIYGGIIGIIFGAIFFAIGVCYARAVWSRIPFATANLVTSITAIKANFGVTLFAYLFAIFGMGWTLIWSIAFVGVYDKTYVCDAQGVCDISYGLLTLLFLAFFFGHQVLQNSTHVITAGVVGTWWVAPDENGCCGRAVINSFIRTMTTSFGSICFGSLLVAILQTLRALAETARANDDAGIGACIAECILGCLASLLEYFNKWAFIYVGVYGYGYLEAGKNVMTLFHNRGWEAIIADDLVDNAIFMISLVVGLIMGAIGLALEATTDWFEDAGGNSRFIAFFLGFIVGTGVCTILLSTIGSGVNAVVVMFADAPAEFQRNHPQLSTRMRETWAQIYPGSIS